MLLLASILYFFYGTSDQRRVGLKSMGKVFKKDNELRRKTDGNLSWTDISDATELFPGDRIFTGAESLAQLNLLDLAEIGMNSSTLLRIDSVDGQSLNLEGGHGVYTTKLTGKVSKATIKIGDKTIELNSVGSEVHVNSDEKKTMITAVNGKISYEITGVNGRKIRQNLLPDQVLGFVKDGQPTVVSLPVRLISPAVSEEVLVSNETPVTFKWKVLTPGIELSLELSKTPDFVNPFFKTDVSGMSEVRKIVDPKNAGMIFWRVVHPPKSEFFHAQRFEYQHLGAPMVYRPVKREIVPLPVPATNEFSWERKFNFGYEGEIQQLDGGTAGSQKFTTGATSYKPKGMTAGHYQFRVRATKQKQVSPWGEWVRFSVGDVDRKGIQLVSPADRASATLIWPDRQVRLTWSGGGVQSQVLIAKDAEFRQLLVESITEKTEYNWKPEISGTYYWTVKSAPKDRIGISRSFQVKEPKLALQLPKDDLDIVYETEGYQEVRFSWDDSSFNGKYIFEYASDPDFNNVIEKVELDRPDYAVSLKKQKQEIYWRVKTVNQTTPARSIRIMPVERLPTPVVKSIQLRIQDDKTVFGDAMTTLERNAGFIEFLLPAMEGAVSYKVEVLKSPDPASRVHEQILKSPLFRWKNPAVGDYFFRMSYFDAQGRQSPFSEVAKLFVLKMNPTTANPAPNANSKKQRIIEDKTPTY